MPARWATAAIPAHLDAACLDLLGIDATHAARSPVEQPSNAIVHQLGAIGGSAARLVGFNPVQLRADLHREGS
jgi:hypothetical protein